MSSSIGDSSPKFEYNTDVKLKASLEKAIRNEKLDINGAHDLISKKGTTIEIKNNVVTIKAQNGESLNIDLDSLKSLPKDPNVKYDWDNHTIYSREGDSTDYSPKSLKDDQTKKIGDLSTAILTAYSKSQTNPGRELFNAFWIGPDRKL